MKKGLDISVNFIIIMILAIVLMILFLALITGKLKDLFGMFSV
ncbi:MAG: hypothetical protein QXU20_02475 [Candidatus Woesearchaeota archaeon]